MVKMDLESFQQAFVYISCQNILSSTDALRNAWCFDVIPSMVKS